MPFWLEDKLKLFKIIAAGAALVALTGCATTDPTINPDPVAYPVTLSDAEVAAVEQAVRSSAKVPETAMFGPPVATVASQDSKTAYVCGTIKSRNSLGIYTGRQPYIGTLTHDNGQAVFTPLDVGGEASMNQTILSNCQAHGITSLS
jgi:hypothetical protein